MATHRISADAYVSSLCDYLRQVHQYVDEQHRIVREDSQRAKYRELGPGGYLSVGDYCLVKRQPTPGVSVRFQLPTFDKCFQVVEVHGIDVEAKAYTLSDLEGNRDGLGFSQPVALERLIPIELLPLSRPAEDRPVEILLNENGQDRRATVTNQCMDGKVYVTFEDDQSERCLDLSEHKYQWL